MTNELFVGYVVMDVSSQRLKRNACRNPMLGDKQDRHIWVQVANLVSQAERLGISFRVSKYHAVDRLMGQ